MTRNDQESGEDVSPAWEEDAVAADDQGEVAEAAAADLGDQALPAEAAGPDLADAGSPGDEVIRLAVERDEYLDALRRLQADFENYRKRMTKQQADQLQRAAEGLVTKLLPVLDTLDLALAHVGGPDAAGSAAEASALAQVAGSLFEVLSKEGLERIEAVGLSFDPAEHDAVIHEDGGGGPEVVEVLRAGWRWRGRVLRPAMVKVKGQ